MFRKLAAVVQGWEVSYQQQFTFLPGLLKGLAFSGNYTSIAAAGNFGGATSRSTNEVPGFIPRTANASLSVTGTNGSFVCTWSGSSQSADRDGLTVQSAGECVDENGETFSFEGTATDVD